MTWTVLTVAPSREFKVEQDLKSQGLKTCVPFEMKVRRARGKGGRPLLIPYKYVLMPGYVIASEEALTLDLKKIDHVRGRVQFDGVPARLSGAEVDRLRQMARHVVTDTPRGLRVGDTVRILDGAFRSFQGAIEALRGTDVAVTVDLFGRPNVVRFAPDQIERV